MGEKGGRNLYGYVQNNPISRVDPLGLLDFNSMGHAAGFKVANACRRASDCKAAFDKARSMLGTVYNNDKVAHCIASCELAKGCGDSIAAGLGHTKEARDRAATLLDNEFTRWVLGGLFAQEFVEFWHARWQGSSFADSREDEDANTYGRQQKNQPSCRKACEQKYGTDPGLPPE